MLAIDFLGLNRFFGKLKLTMRESESDIAPIQEPATETSTAETKTPSAERMFALPSRPTEASILKIITMLKYAEKNVTREFSFKGHTASTPIETIYLEGECGNLASLICQLFPESSDILRVAKFEGKGLKHFVVCLSADGFVAGRQLKGTEAFFDITGKKTLSETQEFLRKKWDLAESDRLSMEVGGHQRLLGYVGNAATNWCLERFKTQD